MSRAGGSVKSKRGDPSANRGLKTPLASRRFCICRNKYSKRVRRPVLKSGAWRRRHGSSAPARARPASQRASLCEAPFELQHLACYLTLSSRGACYGRLKALCDAQANISLEERAHLLAAIVRVHKG